MSATIAELINYVQTELGEVDGAGVQIYSEDRIRNYIKNAVRLIIDRYPWDAYTKRVDTALDGTLGVVTATMTDLEKIEDIVAIWPENWRRTLPRLPKLQNPGLLSGTSVLYFEGMPVSDGNYANKKIQFWPKAATDTITVVHKVRPTDWDDTATIYLDPDLVKHLAAYLFLEGENLNDAAAMKNMNLAEEKFNALIGANAGQGLVHPYAGTSQDTLVPDQWFIAR